jgi:DNA-binding CsgD family transcriptional regulator
VARGLEAFAALAIAEGDPERAVVFVAAATALRADGGLPPLSARRAEQSLAPARQLGEEVVARNWARGLGLGTKAAIEFAITPRQPASPQQVPAQPDPRQPAPAKPASRGLVPDHVAAHPLSAREQEIATLVAAGHSNKEIAQELYISPATVARHIANIMHKLDFHTRTQIAIWTTDHLATS